MSIKTVNKWILAVLSFLAIITFISLLLAHHYRNVQLRFFDVQLKSLALSHQLSEGSDLLSNMVRTFAATGDPIYDELFTQEVNVTRSRDKAVLELRKLGATTNELALIEKAKLSSDELIKLENQAFKAGRSGNLELARQLVFGASYLNEKAKIMGQINEFQKNIELRLAEQVKEVRWRANISSILAFVMVFVMILMGLIAQILFYSRKVVGPLVRLNDAVLDLSIQKRDTGLDVFNDGSEVSILAKSIKDFHWSAVLDSDLQQIRMRIAEITVEIYKAHDLQELTQIVMANMSVFLGVHYGLLYVTEKNGQYLKLVGGYGLPIEDIDRNIHFGEGLVGQCATNKAPIQINKVPENYVKIVSATGSASPVCILIQPLILNQTVLGVIELAAFRQFNENDKLILSELSLALAMSIELLIHREI